MVEIKFALAATPASSGVDPKDHREISVFFRSLRIEATGGATVAVDFSSAEVLAQQGIYGFWEMESQGVWSAGGQSAVVFDTVPSPSREWWMELDATAFLAAFPEVEVRIQTSEGHKGIAKINGSGPVMVRLRRPIWGGSRRMVVGDFGKCHSRRNVTRLPTRPLLTLVVVNREKAWLTRLAAIAAGSSQIQVPFEILCVDNGSSAETLTRLREAEVPMRLIELGQNRGFGVANNLAAEEARGEYVLFLNNDAFLQPGAVSEMLVAFQKHSDCAAIGPVLRYPDGTRQEAGCSVAVDGHPIRHGREDRGFDLKGLPRYRAVDYVSGACLMMRRAEFLAMGGFAPKYSPAYYEDTDLCLRLQARGKRVYLASRATCHHIENATGGGIEAGAWASRTAEANRQIFLKDWGEWLERRGG